MQSLLSSAGGYYGAIISFLLCVAAIASPTFEASTIGLASKWHKRLLSLSLFILSVSLLLNTGWLKEDKVRQSRYRQLCLNAEVDIRDAVFEKGGVSLEMRGLLSFENGQGPRYANFDCSIRADWFPFMVQPATKIELQQDPRPFRKTTYFPTGDGTGKCLEPNQKKIVEPVLTNVARYSVARVQSPLLTDDDIKLGIKGDIVEVADNSTGSVLARLKYFYIHKQFKVCPSREGNFPADAIVLGVLKAHPGFEKIMQEWRR